MKKEFSFGGVTGVLDESIKEEFELLYDSGEEQFYQRKIKTVSDEEELPYEATYLIHVFDMYELTGDEEFIGSKEVELEFVVLPNSLSEELSDDIRDSMGLSDDDDMDLYDIVSHGGASVRFGMETFSDEELEDGILGAMNAVGTMDALRGFYLDKAWNFIGTTGWDVIRYATGKQKELFNFS